MPNLAVVAASGTDLLHCQETFLSVTASLDYGSFSLWNTTFDEVSALGLENLLSSKGQSVL